MFWTDRGPGHDPRYVESESWLEVLDPLSERCTVIAHNISLSLGTADSFDTAYVAQLADWQRRYRYPWHSDHLSFVKVHASGGEDYNAGLALPIPYDEEVLDLVAERIAYVQRALPIPFIVENNVSYVDIPGQDMSEPEFLNALMQRTGCGLLLDIHNVYVNARNHGFDAAEFIAALDLSRVVEIHIAGGNEVAGVYRDSHAGPCPDAVWELLRFAVPRTPLLRAITFEFHDSYYPMLKHDGIAEQLARARQTWIAHR
jgi:uncharacterized protein (UPF0276 family)